MWLLDQLLRRVIRKGHLVVTDHDGKVYEYGPGPDGPDGGMDGRGAIHVRLTDKGAAGHIARYPQLGAGEAYMDGRLTIEPQIGRAHV